MNFTPKDCRSLKTIKKAIKKGFFTNIFTVYNSSFALMSLSLATKIQHLEEDSYTISTFEYLID